jgi:hypothetical protein
VGIIGGQSTISVPNSGVRCLAWLVFIIYLSFVSDSFDGDFFLGCILFIAAVTICRLIAEAGRGVNEIISLLNALWFGLLMYALPIYALSVFVDISVILDMDESALAHSAWLTFVSIGLTGITVEILGPWSALMHNIALQRIAHPSEDRQFYLAVFLPLIYGLNYIDSGVLAVLGSGSRFEVVQVFETGKMWFIQYLMTGITIAFIYQHIKVRSKLSLEFYLILFSVLSFWAMYLSLGNRRGLLTILIAAAVCFIARSANGKRALVMLGMAFIAAGLVGIYRQDLSHADPDHATLIGLSTFFGEFIYPSFTLVHKVQSGEGPAFELTWISNAYQFILAQLKGEQFLFLGPRFAHDVAPPGGVVMGFAYLPVTEAFLNFGNIGAIVYGVVFLTSILTFAYIFIGFGWVYLMLISLALDINRSEFVPMVIQLSIIASGFLLTTRGRRC